MISPFIGYTFSLLFGLVIGSFLNVVVLRYNTGQSLTGRSGCFSCGHRLAVRDLVPLYSYFASRGRCRYCQSLISAQYPLLELITGLVFMLIVYRFGSQPFTVLFYWAASSLLLVIAVYDLRHKIIPDRLVFGLIGLAALSPIITGWDHWLTVAVAINTIHNLLTGVLFYFAFWSLWRYSRGRWIGLGDAKLGLGIGFLLGLNQGLAALLVAFWVGAIVGLSLIGLSRLSRSRRTFGAWSISLKSEIPFAPFLILGVLVALIVNLNVLPF